MPPIHANPVPKANPAIRLAFCILLLTGFFSTTQAQKQSYNWYFGANAGISFNSGSPTALTNGQMNQREGNATISDANGNLLFYTDGTTIWNSTHAVMLNGTGLYGEVISAQSSIIVPMPGSPFLYYIFTVTDWQNTSSTSGLYYSIVDMRLDGGLGAVTATKNVLLDATCREQLAAIYHRNCTDIWIVAHEQPNNNFVAYQLTPAGVSASPVISATGPVNAGVNRYGGLKFSSDARHLCSILGGSGALQSIQLYDFDNSTGAVSNPSILTSAAYPVVDAYSSEFSPDNSKLYVVAVGTTYIYQYDLTLGTAAAIMASRVDIATGSDAKSCVQMGPDKKIYVSKDMQGYLGVINDPNNTGTLCNYVNNGVSLAGRLGRLGLPTFLQSFFAYPYLGNDTTICAGASLLLNSYLTPGTAYLWQDGSVNPTLPVSQPGTYWVETTNNGCSRRDSIVINNAACTIGTPSFTTPDTVCVNSPVTIANTSTGASTYYWSFCSANLSSTTPTGTNMGNIGGAFSTPVFIDYILVNNNWYGFLINHNPGGLIRLDFGNSLLNTPTAVNLGNPGGQLPPGSGSEGIQMVYNEGNYYAIIVGGWPPTGSTSRLLTLNFGTNITNPAPAVSNWGNIGNMAQPIDLYVFKDETSAKWYGFTVNAENNTITRFDFTNSFANTPTAVNLGNIGNLLYPDGIYAINDNGNWRVFVTNGGNRDQVTGPFSLSRLDFGNSLLNTPTGVNLGSLGNTMQHPRDITIMRSCGQIVGFVVNGNPSYYDVVKLDFNNNLAATPTAVSLGNFGGFSFPPSISRLFRVNEDLYGFVPNAANNTMTRLRFAGCTNASISGSTLQNPPAVSYNTPGIYNINLTIDDGLPGQNAYCKQVVVTPPLTHHTTKNVSLCAGQTIKIGAATTTARYLWNDGVTTTDSLLVTAPGTYWVDESQYSCANRDSFIVNTITSPCGIVTPSFTTPDTVCVNSPVTITNTSTGASTYYWSFCSANLSATNPAITNLGNISGQLSLPVFMDYIQVNGNYYGFLINHSPGALIRLDFGNSLLNTPTAVNLGNFGGNIPPGPGSEGVQVVYDQGKYYVIMVGGYTPTGSTPRILTIDFGNNITSTTPVVHNWGNLGSMSQPIDLYVFKDNNNWYGFTVNAENNTITRFDFTNSFNNTPTAVNMGNIGGLFNYPDGLYAVNDNGNWRMFITNGVGNNIIRLDFGASLLNTPTGTDLGTLNGTLSGPRDITVLKSCGQAVAYVVNATSSFLTKLDFNNDLTSVPTAVSLGNPGGVFNFPHSISRLFRVQDQVYGFITNVNTGTLARLQFPGCTNASIGSSALANPAPVTYNTPGTYNINLTVDDGLPTQGAFCKQVVVMPPFTHHAPKNITMCLGDSTKIGAATTNARYLWNDGTTTTDSLVVKTAGTWWVDETNGGCSNRDSFIVTTISKPIVNLGADTTVCAYSTYTLNPGIPGATYIWQDGSTGPSFAAGTSGMYWVAVTIGGGCTVKDTINLIVNSKPRADFSLQLDPCNPLSVGFTNTGTNLPNTWWDFGDGSTTTGIQNPVHPYALAGNYTVRFSVSNGTCTDTINKTIVVGPVQANIITTPDTTICIGSSKKLFTAPALSYCWTPATYLDNPNIANPTTSTPVKITYYLNALVEGTNLIVNGNFNAGNSGFTSGYQYATPNITEGQYYVGPNPQAWNGGLSPCKDHTTGNGNMLLVNGSPVLNVPVWTQTVSVTPNTNYAFSTWIQALFPPNPAQLEFSINGIDIGNPITASLPTCTWSQFYTTWNSGSNTTAVISIINKNTIVLGNDFALDDISFSPLTIQRDSVIVSVSTPVIKATNDTAACQGIPMQLNATGGVTWSWSPATGLNNTTIANPVAIPATTTKYTVTGTDIYGCSATAAVNLTINPQPHADFSLQLDPCNPLLVNFTNIGTNLPATWWDFGDGVKTTGTSNPVHAYANPGNYTVRFSVSTATCTDTVTKAIVVGAVQANVITTPDTTICIGSSKKLFTAPALSYCWTPATYLDNPNIATPTTSTPVKITYYLNALVEGTNLIVNGNFSAGNTGFTSGYQYATPNITEGQYYVGPNPQAWNGGLSPCKDHTTGNGNMLLVNGAPTANVPVWIQTVNVTPNTNYAFSTWIQALYPPNPAQLQFSINGVGIGNPITASLPTCTWTQFYTTWNSGSNTTAVISIVNQNTIVQGNDFALDDISFSPLTIQHDSVIVSVSTPAVKATNDTSSCQGTPMQLNATGSSTYVWTPAGSLSNATISNPLATPAATTRYTVTGTDIYGCSATASVNLVINPQPHADFGMQPDPCNPLLVSFTNIGTNLPATWWDFGDGITTTGVQNPVHPYTLPGNYTVRFSLSNAYCTDTVTKTITVGVVKADIITTPDTTICTGSTKKLFTVPALSYCWTPTTYLDNPAIATPTTSTPVKMTYYLDAQVQGANLIPNGDFSNGNTGFTSTYNYKTINSPGVAGSGEYTITASPPSFNSGFFPCVDHSTGNSNMMLINGAATAGVNVWSTTVTVTPNTNYAFSCWIESMNAISPAQLQFSINNHLAGSIFTASTTPCNWQQFYTTWNSGSATTTTIAIVNQNTAITGNDFALDDISFAPLTIKRDSVTITIDTPVVKATNDTMTCIGTAVQLNATGGNVYSWIPASGLSNPAVANPMAGPTATTQYIVSGTNRYGCTAKDTVLLTVNPLPTITLTSDTTICHDKTIQLLAGGGNSYSWLPAASLSDPAIYNPVAAPLQTTTYTVTVTDANKCVNTAPVTVSVIQIPQFSVAGATTACLGTPSQFVAKGGDVYAWSPAAGLSNAAIANPLATPGVSTAYEVKIIESTCQDSTLLGITLTI